MSRSSLTLALNVRLSCQLLDVPESSYYERIGSVAKFKNQIQGL
ncbi:hypothetical protein [Lactococcus lactis]|nr:hypothetical protein [Lactococcus lactis]WKK99633.1 hypothetical protein LLDRC3_03325 [Lactococcus lactis subsp. lactis]